MEKTRAFICIEFPSEIVKEVARVQELLETRKFTGKLTELENLHLTLKFLGEVDERKLKAVKKKLQEIRLEKFDARLGEAGTFSYRKKPRIVWIKILGKGMIELQQQVDEVLSEIGFKKEERFMSHLTIARVKFVKDKKGFVDYVKNLGVKGLKFGVGEFKLMESELRPVGPVYTEIEEYMLKK